MGSRRFTDTCDRGDLKGLSRSFAREANQLVLGAAVAAAYLRNVAEAADGHEIVMQVMVSAHGREELPTLRRAISGSLSAPSVVGTYTDVLNRLITDYKRRLKR